MNVKFNMTKTLSSIINSRCLLFKKMAIFVGSLCLCLQPMLVQASSCAVSTGSWDVPAAIDQTSDWIKSLQYTNGALKRHDSPAHISLDGQLYYRVVPYNANLAVWGLLQAPETIIPEKLQIARDWIEWYLAHLDLTSKGIVYERWYLEDGSGETTCPAGLNEALCEHDDAADSNAATFLGMVETYYRAGGDVAFLEANYGDIEKVAGKLSDLIDDSSDSDDLSWAKEIYPVKFVMDNSEVYWGLNAFARLAEALGHGETPNPYALSANKVQQGISQSLFSADTALYYTAKHGNGSVDEADLNQWYPSSVAQLWPQLFGVVTTDSPLAQNSMALLNNHWNGSVGVGDNWTNQAVDPNGFLWPSIGYAALMAGACSHAASHTAFVIQEKLPNFPWPATIDDAGWLLMTLIHADEDGDGMPNGWELQHDLNIHDPNDASMDIDGDNYVNVAEYLASSDPMDPISIPVEQE